ncbi:MAG: hypothetical protein CVU56_29930, partial [Deltaproteobacteria bacterium HGW-Deltaproteobacteria-14]
MRTGAIVLVWLAALGGCPADATPAPDVRTADATDTSALDTATPADTAEPPDAADSALHEVEVAPSDSTTEDADSVAADTTPAGPPGCDPILTLGPPGLYLFPFGDADLEPAGGTGAYRFALDHDATGALLHPLTGAYLAGADPGVDVVRLTDVGCVGEATLEVRVVAPLELAPAAATVPPGAGFTFSVAAGSGLLAFAVTSNASGATIDAAGTYLAGPEPGDDVVTVTDLGTGQVASAPVAVRTGAHLVPTPPLIGVPLGETFAPVAAGGSGHLDLVGDGAGLEVVAGAWRVTAPGPHEGVLVDVFTGQQATQRVVGLAPVGLTVARTGASTFALSALGPGDLDGDGYRDAVVGVGEANVARYQSGAVYVYRGGPDGLDPEPAQVISGLAREDELGRAMVVADLDGDGHPDLAAGARRADAAPQADDGAVLVYPGLPGGLFADTPVTALDGPFSSDQLGFSVAACDFNGDGAVDLAGGAWVGEDRALSPLLSNQGAVHVWLGAPGAWPGPVPDQSVYGLAPDATGGWAGVANGRAGTSLATGDFDGDGLCDLATGGYTFDNGAANDGLVLVYRGVARTADDPGGLDPIPSRAFAGDAPGGSRLGWFLAAGDVDGDAVDDLLVSQAYWNHGTGNDRWGAARLFLGGAAFAGPAVTLESPDAADWTATGTRGGDYFGYSVAIGEATGAPPADLVIGVWIGECDGCPSDGGRVDVYAGVAGGLPDAAATRVIPGAAAGDRIGSAVAPLGDVDGDGGPEVIVVAGLGDTLGSDVPRPWVASAPSDEPATYDVLTPLASPGEPGGWRVGQSLAVLADLDGDGLAELAVGAPNQDAQRGSGGHLLLSGVVHLYRGAAAGVPDAPAQTLQDFPGHSGSDWLGYGLAGLADFDGDGAPELASLARYEDRPASFAAATFAEGPGCPHSAVNNGGGVYVFPADGAGGLAPTPAFVYYGPQADDTLERVVGADLDGDGHTDLAVASRLFDASGRSNAGGFVVVRGRPRADPAKTNVVCDAALTWTGVAANDQAGSALAPLGDLDGDGCDELAVGAWLEDLGGANRGAVRVVFGWGPACARAAPVAVTLSSAANDDRAGTDLAAADVDGDGLTDLLVGGASHREANVSVGAVWLVDGRRLRGLAGGAAALVDGVAPAPASPLVTGP